MVRTADLDQRASAEAEATLFDMAVMRARCVGKMSKVERDNDGALYRFATSADVLEALDQPFDGTWGEMLELVAQWLGVESPEEIARDSVERMGASVV